MDHLQGRAVAHVGSLSGWVLADDLLVQRSRSVTPCVFEVHGAASAVGMVDSLLADLEATAVGMFPAWLPEAEALPWPCAAPTLREFCLEAGSRSGHLGPYLADLAERHLGDEPGRRSPFPAEVRAREVGLVLRRAYRSRELVAILELGPGLSAAEEGYVGHAARFLLHNGFDYVYFTGAPFHHLDWVPALDGPLPGTPSLSPAPRPVAADEQPATDSTRSWLPPIEGQPHFASEAEQLLDSLLAQEPWAAGYVMNRTWSFGPLVGSVRPDLAWLDERLVVEIDGPEHRDEHHFEQDRQRDVRFALDGFTVVRYTNRQVVDDPRLVVGQLRQLVERRRTEQGAT